MPTKPRQFVVFKDKSGDWRWALFAMDNQRFAESSASFSSSEECAANARQTPILAFGARMWNYETQSWVG